MNGLIERVDRLLEHHRALVLLVTLRPGTLGSTNWAGGLLVSVPTSDLVTLNCISRGITGVSRSPPGKGALASFISVMVAPDRAVKSTMTSPRSPGASTSVLSWA